MKLLAERFLDTNILIRHFMQDLPDHAKRSSQLIGRIFSGSEKVHVSETMVFETVFTLSSRYKVPRGEVAAEMVQFLENPNVICSRHSELVRALGLWVDEGPLSYADCYHLVLAKSLGLNEIYSFDRKMGRFEGVTRVDP